MKFNFNIPLDTPEEILFFTSNLIVSLCVLAILLVILIDFVEFQTRKNTKAEKKSIVETGTMFLFFFGFYLILKSNIGLVHIASFPLKLALSTLGLFILILGCIVNIKGRLDLGKNWANQIKIYSDHTFISKGAYSMVRHPLYASIIWMFFGASIIYSNLYAFLANLLIFIPFMYHRAKQEEELLSKEFKDYKNYQRKVGIFFPKLIKRK